MNEASRRELVEGFLPRSPFAGKLGIELRELGDGYAELAMPFEAGLSTSADVVHGGAITSLLDTAATAAAWANDDVPEEPRGLTVGLTVDFIAPARGIDLLAKARVIRRGRSLCFLEVDVTALDGTTIAKGLVTYSYG